VAEEKQAKPIGLFMFRKAKGHGTMGVPDYRRRIGDVE
jgi:hypothetical protein